MMTDNLNLLHTPRVINAPGTSRSTHSTPRGGNNPATVNPDTTSSTPLQQPDDGTTILNDGNQGKNLDGSVQQQTVPSLIMASMASSKQVPIIEERRLSSGNSEKSGEEEPQHHNHHAQEKPRSEPSLIPVKLVVDPKNYPNETFSFFNPFGNEEARGLDKGHTVSYIRNIGPQHLNPFQVLHLLFANDHLREDAEFMSLVRDEVDRLGDDWDTVLREDKAWREEMSRSIYLAAGFDENGELLQLEESSRNSGNNSCGEPKSGDSNNINSLLQEGNDLASKASIEEDKRKYLMHPRHLLMSPVTVSSNSLSVHEQDNGAETVISRLVPGPWCRMNPLNDEKDIHVNSPTADIEAFRQKVTGGVKTSSRVKVAKLLRKLRDEKGKGDTTSAEVLAQYGIEKNGDDPSTNALTPRIEDVITIPPYHLPPQLEGPVTATFRIPRRKNFLVKDLNNDGKHEGDKESLDAKEDDESDERKYKTITRTYETCPLIKYFICSFALVKGKRETVNLGYSFACFRTRGLLHRFRVLLLGKKLTADSKGPLIVSFARIRDLKTMKSTFGYGLTGYHEMLDHFLWFDEIFGTEAKFNKQLQNLRWLWSRRRNKVENFNASVPVNNKFNNGAVSTTSHNNSSTYHGYHNKLQGGKNAYGGYDTRSGNHYESGLQHYMQRFGSRGDFRGFDRQNWRDKKSTYDGDDDTDNEATVRTGGGKPGSSPIGNNYRFRVDQNKRSPLIGKKGSYDPVKGYNQNHDDGYPNRYSGGNQESKGSYNDFRGYNPAYNNHDGNSSPNDGMKGSVKGSANSKGGGFISTSTYTGKYGSKGSKGGGKGEFQREEFEQERPRHHNFKKKRGIKHMDSDVDGHDVISVGTAEEVVQDSDYTNEFLHPKTVAKRSTSGAACSSSSKTVPAYGGKSSDPNPIRSKDGGNPPEDVNAGRNNKPTPYKPYSPPHARTFNSRAFSRAHDAESGNEYLVVTAGDKAEYNLLNKNKEGYNDKEYKDYNSGFYHQKSYNKPIGSNGFMYTNGSSRPHYDNKPKPGYTNELGGHHQQRDCDSSDDFGRGIISLEAAQNMPQSGKNQQRDVVSNGSSGDELLNSWKDLERGSGGLLAKDYSSGRDPERGSGGLLAKDYSSGRDPGGLSAKNSKNDKTKGYVPGAISALDRAHLIQGKPSEAFKGLVEAGPHDKGLPGQQQNYCSTDCTPTAKENGQFSSSKSTADDGQYPSFTRGGFNLTHSGSSSYGGASSLAGGDYDNRYHSRSNYGQDYYDQRDPRDPRYGVQSRDSQIRRDYSPQDYRRDYSGGRGQDQDYGRQAVQQYNDREAPPPQQYNYREAPPHQYNDREAPQQYNDREGPQQYDYREAPPHQYNYREGPQQYNDREGPQQYDYREAPQQDLNRGPPQDYHGSSYDYNNAVPPRERLPPVGVKDPRGNNYTPHYINSPQYNNSHIINTITDDRYDHDNRGVSSNYHTPDYHHGRDPRDMMMPTDMKRGLPSGYSGGVEEYDDCDPRGYGGRKEYGYHQTYQTRDGGHTSIQQDHRLVEGSVGSRDQVERVIQELNLSNVSEDVLRALTKGVQNLLKK